MDLDVMGKYLAGILNGLELFDCPIVDLQFDTFYVGEAPFAPTSPVNSLTIHKTTISQFSMIFIPIDAI